MDKRPFKILLIDEDAENIRMLGEIVNFSFPNAEFVSCLSMNDGCNIWKIQEPEVVIINVGVKEAAGYEMCRKIKNPRNPVETLVLMIIPNEIGREGRVTALDAGADGILSNPVDEIDFKAQVRAMIRIKEAEERRIEKKEQLEEIIKERTAALENELADRKKAEKKLIYSLDKLTRNRKAILNLMEDLKTEVGTRKKVQDDLNNERNLLRAIINNIPDTIYLMDRQGRKLIANNADLAIIGYNSEEDVIGKTDLELYPGSNGVRFHEMNLKVMESGVPAVDNEELFKDKYGREIWLYSSYYPLTNAAGEVTGLVGIGHDITERKIAEQRLDEVNSLNRILLQTIPFGMDIVDEMGTILFQSDSFKKIFGSEALGKQCWAVYRDDKKQCADCPLINGITPGITESYISGGVLGGRIFEIIHTGMIFQGKKAMLEIFMDITERKNMENRIIESESYYRTLVDISPDGIIVTDLEGTVNYTSRRSLDIFAIPEGCSITGTSILQWLEPESANVIMERFLGVISGNIRSAVNEYKLLRYNKDVFWAEVSSSPLQDKDGRIYGLMMICRDITERKKAESELIAARNKAEESDRLKTAFLHNISHEIRTPMNAIIGFSALLGEPGQTDETRASFIEVINSSSNHLLAVVSDIIEISNIEAGILKFNPDPVNLTSLLRNLNSQFILKAAEKGLNLSYNLTVPQEKENIISDKTKLTVILNNLLSNALKFTHRGTISLICELKKSYLQFTVSDTGIGIPSDKQAKIFDRFFQVESTVSRSYDGTGLGLAISKAYVEFLGGKISVNSEPDNGSVFTFTVPYVQNEASLETVNSLKNENARRIKSAGKILVAEDEDNNYSLMVHYLSASGLEYLRAVNGKEAVEICSADDSISMVLMDIKMPVMDGYEATRQIKRMKPGLPVIAQTAYAFDSDMEKALEAGCDEWISKPVKREKLKELLKKYCLI